MNELENQIIDFLDYCQYQKMLNHKTLKAYRIDLKQFTDYFSNVPNPLTKNRLCEFIKELHAKYKAKTVKRKIACIRAFINYLVFEEQITANPLKKIHLEFREPIPLPKSLPLSTIKKLFKVAYDSPNLQQTYTQCRIQLRNIAVLELLFSTGIRVSELCSIIPADIDLKNGYVKVQGKGSRERIIYISNPDTLSALFAYHSAYAQKIAQSGCFFINRLGNQLSEQSVRKIIKNYAELADIPEHITPHMLRHSFATLMLEEDVNIRYIQNILGHSSITTTQIYTHVSLTKQKSIMREKHPRNRIVL